VENPILAINWSLPLSFHVHSHTITFWQRIWLSNHFGLFICFFFYPALGSCSGMICMRKYLCDCKVALSLGNFPSCLEWSLGEQVQQERVGRDVSGFLASILRIFGSLLSLKKYQSYLLKRIAYHESCTFSVHTRHLITSENLPLSQKDVGVDLCHIIIVALHKINYLWSLSFLICKVKMMIIVSFP
jgi:hypothetical protein